MSYIKFNVEVRPYKDATKEEDEMDALTRKVLNDIKGVDLDDEDEDLGEPIWLDTYYNSEKIKGWTRCHKGIKAENVTVLYLNDEEFIVINQSIEEVLEILAKL